MEEDQLVPFKPLTLKNKLSEQQVASFTVNQHQFPGIYVEAGLKRHYPHTELMTHVLGYVGKINSRDKAMLEKNNNWKNYAATKDIGKQGIEKFYESLLHGLPGHLEEEVNNRGRVIRTLKVTPPTPGQDIYLTLDLKLQQKAMELLDFMGLADKASKKPNSLSGGEQQRVAVARALINDPHLIFADEPTGNLDSENAYALHELFIQLRDTMNQSFLIVTHNEDLADRCNRKLTMKDGKIIL